MLLGAGRYQVRPIQSWSNTRKGRTLEIDSSWRGAVDLVFIQIVGLSWYKQFVLLQIALLLVHTRCVVWYRGQVVYDRHPSDPDSERPIWLKAMSLKT